MTDSTAPVGQGSGPDSEKLLVAAVANCLSASLLFSLRKFNNEAVAMQTIASVQLVRNEHARLRMGSIHVEIQLGVPAGALKHLDRAIAQFEDFCVVTQSVRAAIPSAFGSLTAMASCSRADRPALCQRRVDFDTVEGTR